MEISTQSRATRDHIDRKFDELRAYIDRRVEGLRRELGERLEEVKKTQDAQGATMLRHGEAIARIEVRLENGDRKLREFDQHVKGESGNPGHMAAVIGGARRAAVPTAFGAAVGAAIMAMLSGGTPPAKPQPQRPAIEQRQPADPAPNTKPVIQQE